MSWDVKYTVGHIVSNLGMMVGAGGHFVKYLMSKNFAGHLKAILFIKGNMQMKPNSITTRND